VCKWFENSEKEQLGAGKKETEVPGGKEMGGERKGKVVSVLNRRNLS